MTLHEDLAIEHMHKMMSSPEGVGLVYDYYTGIRGRWSRDYVDMLGQHHVHSSVATWPLDQIWSFGWLHTAIETGRVGFIRVRTGGTPHSDKMRKINADMLAILPEPFEGEVDMAQNGAPCDGSFRWTRPIKVETSTERTKITPDGGIRTITAPVAIKPGELPLEIGDTFPSRTILHLAEEGGVARWPYGTDWISILVDMTRRFAPLEISPEDLVAPQSIKEAA